MQDFRPHIRVREKVTGRELEITASMYEFNPSGYELLDGPKPPAAKVAADKKEGRD